MSTPTSSLSLESASIALATTPKLQSFFCASRPASALFLLPSNTRPRDENVYKDKASTVRCFISSQPLSCCSSYALKSLRYSLILAPTYSSFPAPVLDVLTDDYQTWTFNGTFRDFSPYKGPPSDDVDRAWRELFNCTRFTLCLAWMLPSTASYFLNP